MAKTSCNIKSGETIKPIRMYNDGCIHIKTAWLLQHISCVEYFPGVIAIDEGIFRPG